MDPMILTRSHPNIRPFGSGGKGRGRITENFYTNFYGRYYGVNCNVRCWIILNFKLKNLAKFFWPRPTLPSVLIREENRPSFRGGVYCRALTNREVGEMVNVSFLHQSTKNRLMEEYLIYFHFRLMHHRIVPRLAIPASRWDWHVPENDRNCSGWSSFQFCVVSDPMSLFTTTIVLPSCSVAIWPASIFGQIWKFPKFLHTPLSIV